MDLRSVLAQLRKEREAIDAAIANLERLENHRLDGSASVARHRGCPPMARVT